MSLHSQSSLFLALHLLAKFPAISNNVFTIENTVVANATYKQKKCNTFRNNTHSNAENLGKQAEHCHT